MRRPAMLALLLTLAAGLAGCTLGETDESGAPGPTPPPAGVTTPATHTPSPASPAPTTPTPRPATPTNASAPPQNATAPAPEANVTVEPEGVEVLNTTFDFSTGEALVPLQASDTFEVPAGYGRVVVNVTFADKGVAQPTDRDCTVGLVPPGMVVPIATVGGVGGTSGGMSSTATAGTWTLRYDGQGPVEARILVRLV